MNIFLKKIFAVSVLTCMVSLTGVPSVSAQASSLSLSITPPLFQLTIGPGESWASSIKVINPNSYDLTLYASVMNFESQGDAGGGKFTPVVDEDPALAEVSLARWIKVSNEPIFVAQEQSVDLPFSVDIPIGASPGGHYAAILVGTQPVDEAEGSFVKVSSFVSSLFFVSIKGNIREQGSIREFISDKNFYDTPDVNFTLRFENSGTVHLQPKGEIVIYNMWGKERGTIPINQFSDFGNVLPNSDRKFDFEWHGEENFFEAGKYRAVVTLSFGNEAQQNVTEEINFWVVPLKPTLGILGGFVFFILVLFWGVRMYVKRALREAGGVQKQTMSSRVSAFSAPLREGVVDLRHAQQAHRAATSASGRRAAMNALFRKYYKFFIFITIVVAGVVVFLTYFNSVLLRERAFDVVLEEDGRELRISSTELEALNIEPEEDKDETGLSDVQVSNDPPNRSALVVTVLNGSGVAGEANRLAALVAGFGFNVTSIGNAEEFDNRHSTIYYRPGRKSEAQVILEAMPDTTILQERSSQTEDFVIVVGRDFSSE